MQDQISGTNDAQNQETEVDPWAAAFAALEHAGESNTEGSSDTGGNGVVPEGKLEDTNGANQGQEVSNQAETSDSDEHEDSVGGLDSSDGRGYEGNGNAFQEHLGVSEESIQKYEQDLTDAIRDRTIKEIAEEFIKRGERNNNGVLGATINDDDICKRDSDGVPRFYNPETGREFTGDNPRRQAQEWVDDYNKELARSFNEACSKYEQYLKQQSEPALAIMKFAPKYEKLDDIRRGMFDNVIQDYEVKDDSGSVVGYSCDLDKALALVDRQIAMIQDYAKRHAPDPETNKASSPALDMKTSSGAVGSNGGRAEVKSLEEAMELLQNEQLAKLDK